MAEWVYFTLSLTLDLAVGIAVGSLLPRRLLTPTIAILFAVSVVFVALSVMTVILTMLVQGVDPKKAAAWAVLYAPFNLAASAPAGLLAEWIVGQRRRQSSMSEKS